MSGGTIKKIYRLDDKIKFLVVDGFDAQWRWIEYNERTRCISEGDTVWWHMYTCYWSCGTTKDINIGKCYSSNPPKKSEVA